MPKLSEHERAERDACIAAIDEGLRDMERGRAKVCLNILKLDEKRLWRETHPTVEAMVYDYWGHRRQWYYRQLSAGRVYRDLGDAVLPRNPSVANELKRVPVDDRVDVWAYVLSTCGEAPTALQVRAVVREMYPAKEPPLLMERCIQLDTNDSDKPPKQGQKPPSEKSDSRYGPVRMCMWHGCFNESDGREYTVLGNRLPHYYCAFHAHLDPNTSENHAGQVLDGSLGAPASADGETDLPPGTYSERSHEYPEQDPTPPPADPASPQAHPVVEEGTSYEDKRGLRGDDGAQAEGDSAAHRRGRSPVSTGVGAETPMEPARGTNRPGASLAARKYRQAPKTPDQVGDLAVGGKSNATPRRQREKRSPAVKDFLHAELVASLDKTLEELPALYSSLLLIDTIKHKAGLLVECERLLKQFKRGLLTSKDLRAAPPAWETVLEVAEKMGIDAEMADRYYSTRVRSGWHYGTPAVNPVRDLRRDLKSYAGNTRRGEARAEARYQEARRERQNREQASDFLTMKPGSYVTTEDVLRGEV